MAERTSAELEQILEKKEDYQAEAIEAVIWELEKRGRENYSLVTQQIEEQRTEKEERKRKESNYIEDPSAPKLYPKWSIYVMAGLFTPFFAGIMMAMNFRIIGNRKQIPIVIGFTLLFTVLVGFFADIASTKLNTPSSLTNFLNLIGAGFLGEYFWNRKLGKNIKYRKKSTLFPFALAIAFTAIVIWAIITEERL